ncbi:hypothetical protein BLAT2472_20376 [Burkholderia latens]
MNRPLSGRIVRMLPGVALLANYRRAWLSRDLYAGLALSAVLVPVGMSYAQASRPACHHGPLCVDRRIARLCAARPEPDPRARPGFRAGCADRGRHRSARRS